MHMHMHMHMQARVLPTSASRRESADEPGESSRARLVAAAAKLRARSGSHLMRAAPARSASRVWALIFGGADGGGRMTVRSTVTLWLELLP